MNALDLERARSLSVILVSAIAVQEPTYTIAEVAERTGVTAHTLRYYERAGLIDPTSKSRGGYRLYDHDAVRGNPRTGWVYVETIRDFSSAMPAPVPAKAEVLMQSWQNHWEGIGTRDADADAVTDAVDDCRAAVVETIRTLR